MESFKIENFLRANPGVLPPRFEPLTDPEVNKLKEKLLVNAGQHPGQPQDILRFLSSRATPLAGVDLREDEVPLQDLFRMSGITAGTVLYLVWGSLTEIDRFQAEDLNRFFYDVWYPSSDDIELFDDCMEWIVFVRHYGGVEVWRALE